MARMLYRNQKPLPWCLCGDLTRDAEFHFGAEVQPSPLSPFSSGVGGDDEPRGEVFAVCECVCERKESWVL